MDLQALIEQRLKLVADMRKLLEEAPDGVMSAEAEERYNAMDAEQEKLEGRIQREARLREVEQRLSEPQNKKAPMQAGGAAKSSDQSAELHLRCFRSYLQFGQNSFHTEDFAQLRSMNAGLVTEGGAFVPPQQFVAELIKAVDDMVKIRGLARTFQVRNAGSLGFPTWDTDYGDAEWTTELGTGSLDEAARTGLREFKPTPVAKRVKVSRKLLRHSVLPVEALIRERLAYKFAVTQEKAFMTGNGAGKPLGLFVASDAGIPTGRDVATDNETTAPTADGLINALFSLKEQYQAVATWLFHRDVLKVIRKLKDGNGQYLWAPGISGGIPGTILERPYVQSEFAPNTLAPGQYAGLVGDFSKYWIVDDIGTLEVQKLVELYAESNQDGFIGRMESDGMPILGEAFARVKLA